MEKSSHQMQAPQRSKSGLPPMHPDKQSVSDASEKATVDHQAKSNSRFGHRLTRFMESGDILADQDVNDGNTQQTNDARYDAQDFHEDTDQYMMTKIKSSQGRQFKPSQQSESNAAESSEKEAQDYESIAKRQSTNFGRRGTEQFKVTESIQRAVDNGSQQQQHSMELHAESHIQYASFYNDQLNQAPESSEQITMKPLKARSIHNVSSVRGDLPLHELENEQSLGTSNALINPKINQDAKVQRLDTFSAMTQSNESAEMNRANEPIQASFGKRPQSTQEYCANLPIDHQRLSSSAKALQNVEIQIASGEMQMVTRHQSQLEYSQDQDEIHQAEDEEEINVEINAQNVEHVENQDALLTMSEQAFAEELGNHIRKQSQHSNELIYFGHQGRKDSAEQPSQQLSDQMIFSRLPQNYFIQYDEPEDVYCAQNQLQQMRQEFFSYVQETHATTDLQDALDPSKFIRKHFGAEGVQDPEFLFKEIITEIPEPVQDSHAEEGRLITGEILLKGSRNFESFDDRFAQSTKEDRAQSYPANIMIHEKRHPSVHQLKDQPIVRSNQNEENTISEVRSSTRQDLSALDHAKQSQKSVKQGLYKRKKQRKTEDDTQIREQINNLRINDYFTPGMNSQNSQGAIIAISEDTAEKIIEKWKKPKTLRKYAVNSSYNTTITAPYSQFESVANSSLHRLVESQEEAKKQREEFEAKLERDVLDNVDTNFLFNQGVNLATGLIDLDRLYTVMNKIKELAYKQLSNGSKEIDYQEIVKFVQQENGLFTEQTKKEKPSIFDLNKQNASLETRRELTGILTEPVQPELINNAEENQRRWSMCLSFLRNNPKLMMQMIPDLSDDDVEGPRHTVDGNSLFEEKPKKTDHKGRLHLKLDEAKKWQDGKPRISAKNQHKNMFQPYNQIRPNKGNQQRNAESLTSQERRELCTSGNPRQSIKPRQLQPLTSKNYPNGELSFVTRSGLNPQYLEQDEPSFRPRSGSQNNQQNSRRASAYDAQINHQSNFHRGQSSIGPRQRRSPIRPQTGQITKSQFQLSEQNYQTGDFMRDFQSQKISVNFNKNRQKGLHSDLTVSRQHEEVKTFQNTNDKLSLNSCAPFMRNANIVKRPITAGVNRSLKSNQRSRERLASNKVLQEHAHAQHSLRKYLITRGMSGASNLQILSSSGAVLSTKSMQSSRQPQNDSYIYPTSQDQRKAIGTINRVRNSKKGCYRTDQMLSSLAQSDNDYKVPIQEETYQANFDTVDATPAAMRAQQMQQDAIYETEKRLACDPQMMQIEGEIISDEITVQKKTYIPNRASQSSLSAKLKQADYSQLQIRDANKSPYQADSNLLRGIPNIEESVRNANSGEASSEVKLSGGANSTQSIYQIVKNLPIVDWAYSPICVAYLKGQTQFNAENNPRFFVETEIDYVIDMIKDRFQEFKKTETMLPFYTKALETLQALLLEQQMIELFAKFSKMYSEVTIENTLKLLLRCKLAFQSRVILADIFNAINKYEASVKQVQDLLDKQTAYKLEIEELAHIRLMAGRMREAANIVFHHIKILQADKKSSYNQSFIYKKKDLIFVIKSEINEITQLIDVLRPKRRPDSPDSEKRGRYMAGIEDVPSSSSQETMSKADSQNLNQATEFHWEPTASMMRDEKEQQRQERYINKQKIKWQEQRKSVENENFSRKWYKQKKDW